MLPPALPTTSWSAFIIAFFTPASGVFDPVISSGKRVSKYTGVIIPEYEHTCNEWINPRSQRNEDTKTLRGSVAKRLAIWISETTSESTLKLGQEWLDSKRNLLQEFVEGVEDST